MQQKEFGLRRSGENTKPRVTCPPVEFYQCRHCKKIFQNIYPENGTKLFCCNKIMHLIDTKTVSEVLNDIFIDYKILGGHNENVIRVFWEVKSKNINMEWVYLKTFTGGQIKYVTNPQKSYFIFALADEDSYVYCDEEICLECTFRCKRGFEIYAYIKEKGIIKIPLERMASNW